MSSTSVPRAASMIAVSTKPGWTEFTRTPSSAQPMAAVLVIVRTAPLAAWYAGDAPNPPLEPKIELMLTTEPRPDALRAAAAVFMPRKTLVCVIAMVRS